QDHAFGFGRTGQRKQRIQVAIQIFKVRSRQSVETLAELCSANDFVDRIKKRQGQDRQPNLREQAQFFGNDVGAAGYGLDLEALAVTPRKNRQVVIRDSEELTEENGDLITASGLGHYY